MSGTSAKEGLGPLNTSDRASAPSIVVGHCLTCNAMIVRSEDGSCPQGHSPDAVAGFIELAPGQPLPHLPGFNWGAFLIPPIWGVAHGLWSGVFFLPLWAFVDSVIRSTLTMALWVRALSWLSLLVTLGFQYEFGRTANRLAWRRACRRMTLGEYVRVQRLWAVGGGLAFAGLAAWIAVFLAR
jgi:hypothetical protein